MAYKEVHRVEISEVIRRWQAGNSQRSKATGTGLSRETVRRCAEVPLPTQGQALAAGQEAGVAQEGPAATADQRSVLASVSRSGPREPEAPSEEKLAPWSDQIYQWLTQDQLQFTRIQELLAERGCRISYSSRHRWLSRRHWQRRRSASTVRMGEGAPGEVAELGFGRLGYIQDPATGRRGAVWALLVVLAHSRHSFLWPSYSQKLEEVIAGLEAAWAFFDGIPKYRVIDNFPAAVAGADSLHPRLTRGFLEYSQHRGFITGPARVRIYHRGRLVKVQPRQPRGGRATDAPDYPAELSAYTLRAPDGIKRSAAEQGPAVAEFAERLFDGPLPWTKLRQGHKLIRLGQRYTPERLDSACRRTLEVDLIDVRRVERILLQALEQAEPPEQPPPLPAGRFARPGSVFAPAKGQLHLPTESTELKTGGQS